MQKQKRPFLSGNRRKVVGVLLLIGPFIMLILTIALWAIIEFAVSASLSAQDYSFVGVAHAQTTGELQVVPSTTSAPTEDFFGGSTADTAPYGNDSLENPSLGSTAVSLIRVVLGFIGIFSMAGIFVGIPFGVYLLATKHPSERDPIHPSHSSPQGTQPDKSLQEPPAQPEL